MLLASLDFRKKYAYLKNNQIMKCVCIIQFNIIIRLTQQAVRNSNSELLTHFRFQIIKCSLK